MKKSTLNVCHASGTLSATRFMLGLFYKSHMSSDMDKVLFRRQLKNLSKVQKMVDEAIDLGLDNA